MSVDITPYFRMIRDVFTDNTWKNIWAQRENKSPITIQKIEGRTVNAEALRLTKPTERSIY